MSGSNLCSDFVTCDVCGGSGEDQKQPYKDCPRCAGKGERPRHVAARWSPTRLEWVVVVESLKADVDEVILWGRCIGSEVTEYGEDYITVAFADGQGQNLPRVPERFSERQLRWIFQRFNPSTES